MWSLKGSPARVHFMHLGPKISGVDLAFLSAWRRGNSLNHTLWRTGVINCVSDVRQPQPWRISEELLA